MSTTQPQQTALTEFVPTHSSGGLTPEDAFDEFVLDEPDVCNTCFSVIRRDHRKREAGEHAHAVEDHDPFGEHVVRLSEHAGDVALEPADTYGELRTYPERTACGNCGAFAGDTPSETLSRRDALQRVPALTARLEEHGLQVNEHAIRTAVRHLKSDDDHAGRDMDIFRTATALGIEHGSGLAATD